MAIFRYILIFASFLVISCSKDKDSGREKTFKFRPEFVAGETDKNPFYWIPGFEIGMIRLNSEAIDVNSKRYALSSDGFVYTDPEDISSIGNIADWGFVYPFQDNTQREILYDIDITNQSDQQRLDILYGSTDDVEAGRDGIVPIYFSRTMAKITFDIDIANYYTPLQLKEIKVEIHNIARNGDLGADGTICNQRNKGMVRANSTANGIEIQATVMPFVAAGEKVVFMIGDKELVWEIPTGFEFRADRSYKFWTTLTHSTCSLYDADNIYYTIGDYYPTPADRSTAEGVVFWLKPDCGGQHGKIIDIKFPSHTNRLKAFFNDAPLASSMVDGKQNSEILYSSHEAAGIHYNVYAPGFMRQMLGEEWYIPAVSELQDVFKSSAAISLPLSSVGAQLWPPYISSTEQSNNMCYIVYSNSFYTEVFSMSTYPVRAIKEF